MWRIRSVWVQGTRLKVKTGYVWSSGPQAATALKPAMILYWTSQHGLRNTSGNHCLWTKFAIHKCKLKLYRAKKMLNVKCIQKHHRLHPEITTDHHHGLRENGKLFWSLINPNFKLFLETMDTVFCGLKGRGTIQVVISGQFKSLHLWWYGVALLSMAWSSYSWPHHCWRVHSGFRATYAPIQATGLIHSNLHKFVSRYAYKAPPY